MVTRWTLLSKAEAALSGVLSQFRCHHTRHLCSVLECGPSGRYAAAREGQRWPVSSAPRAQEGTVGQWSVAWCCARPWAGVLFAVGVKGAKPAGWMVHGKGTQHSLQMPPEAEPPEPQGSAGVPRTVPGDGAAEATCLSRLQPSSLLGPRGQSVLGTSVECSRGQAAVCGGSPLWL